MCPMLNKCNIIQSCIYHWQVWDETKYPWSDLMELTITTTLPHITTNRTYYNLNNRPACLHMDSPESVKVSDWDPNLKKKSTHMMKSSNGNIFRVTGPLCGEFTGHRWIPLTQRPVTQSFEVFFDLRLNKRLNKQSQGWWFEMPPRPLWRHYNAEADLILEYDFKWGIWEYRRALNNRKMPTGQVMW